MVIAAAGAVDHDRLVELAGNALADLAADAGPPPAWPRPTAAARCARSATSWRPRSCWASRACPMAPTISTPRRSSSSIIGGGMSSRLFQEVREKRGLCYSIYAFHWSFADTGIFGVHAATGPEDVDRADAGHRRRTRARRRRRSADKEVKRARAQLRAGLLMTLESPAARAGQLARQLLLFGRDHPARRTGGADRGDRRRRRSASLPRASSAAPRRSRASARSTA